MSQVSHSSHLRYFVNNLQDYTDGTVTISKDVYKNECKNLLRQIAHLQKTTLEAADGGLYVGIGGIAYLYYYISQHEEMSDVHLCEAENGALDLKYIELALTYVESRKKKKSDQASFLLEGGGIYAVAAAIYHRHKNEVISNQLLQKYVALADVCIDLNFLPCGSDELFVGRAGYLCGSLFLEKVFQKQVVPEEKLFMLCDAIIKSGQTYSQQVKSSCPLMYQYYDTEYLGAAHGLCSILQMLLNFPKYLDQNPACEQKVYQSVNYLLSLQTPSGNFPCATDEVERPRAEKNELVHWCHGAPGVVYLMIKAYLRWKDDKYLKSALDCGEITWKKGLLKKGPGICHGIAGSGYVFLALYRLTGNQKHLYRAKMFADFLKKPEFQEANTPDNPLSLYEGTAGTALFLADLTQPDKAEFPFFNVF